MLNPNLEVHRIVIARSEEPELNMIYTEVGGDDYEVLGSFSGICGGLGLFLINTDGEATVSDDFNEFQSKLSVSELEATFKYLEKERATFEATNDEGELVGLSDAGLEFISTFDESDEGIVNAFSEEASDDMIYDIQDEWNLDFYLD